LKAKDGDELLRAQSWLVQSEELINDMPVLPFDVPAAAQFDKLRQQKKLKKIGRADLLISSIALANQATLVTRNLKHFQSVPNLKIENWAD
jgi:tRNA(fMet)-specific endonuclease VapC